MLSAIQTILSQIHLVKQNDNSYLFGDYRITPDRAFSDDEDENCFVYDIDYKFDNETHQLSIYMDITEENNLMWILLDGEEYSVDYEKSDETDYYIKFD
jgi:hypothetical protein